MSRRSMVYFLLIGAVVWAVATAFYRAQGASLFEASEMAFWLNAALASAMFCGLLWLACRLFRIQGRDRMQAALLIAVPGMIGEIPLLLAFDETMATMAPSTAGRYAAMLFCGYSALLICAMLLSSGERARSSTPSVSGTARNPS